LPGSRCKVGWGSRALRRAPGSRRRPSFHAAVDRQGRAGDEGGFGISDERGQGRHVIHAATTSECGERLCETGHSPAAGLSSVSIVSHRLKGEQPTLDLMIGYRNGNPSLILKTSPRN
jgi:hypothetical protein